MHLCCRVVIIKSNSGVVGCGVVIGIIEMEKKLNRYIDILFVCVSVCDFV